jgi:hypothetical protein
MKMNNDFICQLKHSIHIVTSLTFNELTTNTRKQNIVDVRMIFAKILIENNFDIRNVAKIIIRDRTSIIHYLNRYPYFLKTPNFAKLDRDIRANLIDENEGTYYQFY